MATSNKPRVLFSGKLKMTAERENDLMQYAVNRRNAIRMEMGWEAGSSNAGRGVYSYGATHTESIASGWALKRREAWAQYENDFSHRLNHRRFGTLYKLFNESINVPKRCIDVWSARARENLVATNPFVTLLPEGRDDDADAIKIADRIFNHELIVGDVRHEYREGIKQAAVSEAVMKTTITIEHEEDEEGSFSFWLGPDGEPVRDSNDYYIFSDDEITDSAEVVGEKVVKRDPLTIIPEGSQLSPLTMMTRRGKSTQRLDQKPVGWENFFCSPLAADIHSADCIFHEFDEDWDVLYSRTKGKPITKKAMEWLKALQASAMSEPKTEGGQPKTHRGERDVEIGSGAPCKIHCCEMWMRYDALGTGYAQEICVTWAVASGGSEMWPIWYELLKDCSPTKKRPFDVWRAIPVKDRWYGFGFYDLLSNEHRFIDDCWTRLRARSSASGRFDWMKKGAWHGTELGQPVSLSTGKVWYLKEGAQGGGNENAGSIQLPELDARIWQMLEMAMRNAQLISGTMTAGDAQVSGMPANNTATGINALANESELMSGDTTQDLVRGMTHSLQQAFVAVFDNLDVAIADVLGPDDYKTLTDWLSKVQVKKWARYVRLLLTKQRNKQTLEAVMNANKFMTGGLSWLQIVSQWGAFTDTLRPLFVDALNAHDIANADKMLTVPTQFLQQQQAMMQQAAAGQPQPQPAA